MPWLFANQPFKHDHRTKSGTNSWASSHNASWCAPHTMQLLAPEARIHGRSVPTLSIPLDWVNLGFLTRRSAYRSWSTLSHNAKHPVGSFKHTLVHELLGLDNPCETLCETQPHPLGMKTPTFCDLHQGGLLLVDRISAWSPNSRPGLFDSCWEGVGAVSEGLTTSNVFHSNASTVS